MIQLKCFSICVHNFVWYQRNVSSFTSDSNKLLLRKLTGHILISVLLKCFKSNNEVKVSYKN